MKKLLLAIGAASVLLVVSLQSQQPQLSRGGAPSLPFNPTQFGTNNGMIVYIGGTNAITNLNVFIAYISNFFSTNIFSENAYFNLVSVTNLNVINGRNNTLIITNNIQFLYTTLTMSGSNVSTISLTNTAYKLTLTNNGFLNAVTDFPGTNNLQTFQLHISQDGTGGRSLIATNSTWVVSGSGTSTNAVLSITTNANAISILTFATSPFSATKVYSVNTPF